MNKIKKDDLVVVIAGKDKDKQGKVISVDNKEEQNSGSGLQHGYQAHKAGSGQPTGRHR